MIAPTHLEKGDTISIVAPGKKTSRVAVENSIKIFKEWGLNVHVADNIFSDDHPYLAGTDAQRLDDFQRALNSNNVKAIICARGGYGSTRILDQLNYHALLQYPKWIVGFSDITAFHLKLSHLGYQSIHSTMPVLFTDAGSAPSVESLRNLLFGLDNKLTVPAKSGNKNGKTKGETVGGNLSLIVDSMGTSSEPDTEGKILILEEVEEYIYKIDRMLTQLKRADKLKSLAGLVIGHFTNMQDTSVPFGESVEQIILNAVREYNYPVAFGFPIGHENPNLAWCHGAEAIFEVNAERASLSFSIAEIKNI
jgi:muramoyltetrapeptide carboxypeptidase